jgi:hypothetical protein
LTEKRFPKTWAQRIRCGTQFVVLGALCLASAWARQLNEPDELRALEASIRGQLEQHGERVMGKDAYRWSTRLDTLSACRATLVETVTINVDELITRRNEVTVPLGKIGQSRIEPDNNWLVLICLEHERCIFIDSTCTKTTKQGFTVDCSSPGGARQEELHLQLDRSASAAKQLERDFRRAIELCQAPALAVY